MRVGIIYSAEKKIVESIAHGLKRGLEEQGATVRMFPDTTNTLSGLSACNLVFVGGFVMSIFKGKTPQRLREVLQKATGIAGKRSVAFVPKSGMGERKALLSLMQAMEKQGCYLIDQLSIASEKDAYAVGKRMKLK